MGLLFASDVKWLYANGFMSYRSSLVHGIERFDDLRFVAALETSNNELRQSTRGPISVFVRYDVKASSWVATCFDLIDAGRGCYVQFSADSEHAQDAVQTLLGKIEAYKPGGQDD